MDPTLYVVLLILGCSSHAISAPIGFRLSNIFEIKDEYRKPGLVAYDCKTKMKVATISLIETQDCLTEKPKVEKIGVRVAVTQTPLFTEVPFFRCHIIRRDFFWRCGKTIDQMPPAFAKTSIVFVTRSECDMLIKHGQYTILGGPTLKSEKGSGKEYLRFVSHGRMDPSGSCIPGRDIFIDGIHYERPVVNTEFEITYTSGHTKVDIEEKKIILPFGGNCKYDEEACHHADWGYIFWNIASPSCEDSDDKELVFIGYANQVTESGKTVNSTYIVVNHKDQDFQLKLHNKGVSVCGRATFVTEHPRLFVTILNNENDNFPMKMGKNVDVNWLSYLNTKFVSVVRRVDTKIDNVFEMLRDLNCITNNRVTNQMLALATTNPTEFAYRYFSAPGYTAITRGEVAHVAQCTPVQVTPSLLPPGECYNEFPVVYNNKSYFMTPISRILIDVGTIIDCTTDVNPQYRIGDQWVTVTSQGLIVVKNPEVYRHNDLDYKFRELSELEQGGLYSRTMIENMQRALVSPYEEKIIPSRLTSAMRSGKHLPEGYQIYNGFGQADIDFIGQKVTTVWQSFLNKMGTFGNICSTAFGFYVLFKMVVCLLTSVVNFKELYTNFGLITACLWFWWDSMTHHIFRKREEELSLSKDQKLDNETELRDLYPNLRDN